MRRKTLKICVTILIVSNFLGCSSSEKEDISNEFSKLTDKIVVEFNSDKANYINYYDNQNIVTSRENVEDVYYSREPFALINVVREDSSKNKIEINDKKQKIVLDKYYYYENTKLSDNGKYVTYYAYEDIDREVKKGLFIYDIEAKEEIVLPENYSVSGSNFSIVGDELYFYGVNYDDKNQGIYSFNIKSKAVTQKQSNIDGWAIYYKKLDEHREARVTFNGEVNTFSIIKDGKVEFESTDIGKAQDVSYYDGNYYIFEGANTVSLYKITEKDMQLKRLTFDFPSTILTANGYMFKDEKLYFVGRMLSDNSESTYYLDIKTDSIFVDKRDVGSIKLLG